MLVLKKKVGNQPVFATLSHEVDDQGQLLAEPMAILDRRIVKRGNKAVTQWLIQWTNSFPEDAT